ncbi:MAG: hypothetical protein ABJD88_00645, partial [Paraglaciecola sp.]
ALDLAVVAVLLLIIFVVYLYKLVRDIGKEEDDVQSTLQLTAQEMEERQQLAFKNVERCGYVQIALLLILGVLGAVLGGESIAEFASLVIDEMGVSGIVAALILAVLLA